MDGPSRRWLGGKVALVTGSAIGLGAALARRFAAEGARVIVTGTPEARGRALAAELPDAIYVAADLRDPRAIRALVAEAIERCGGVDVLVNNAAVSQRATIEEITPELVDEQYQVILRAPLLLVQAALPSLRARRGVVINIGSINARIGWPDLLAYAAAKAALVTASRNLAHALRYERVRVHCLNPGWTDTEGERATMARLGHPPDFLDRQGARMPLGRLLAPEEIAEVAALLASDRAAAFSGAVVELEQYPTGALGLPDPPGQD